MKTYNALSKPFTDEVKIIMGEGKSIDDAFEDVKSAIIDNNFGEPTPTPIPESTPTPAEPTPAPIATPTPIPESTPTPAPGQESPTPTPEPDIETINLTQGDGQQDGYYYVNLGLSVNWATCNVGANVASYDGLLFQFGRVDGYKYGDINNQFRTMEQNAQDTGNGNIPKTASGKTYKEGEILDLEDDAAYAYMGGVWHMPNQKDLDDLYTYTTYEVKTIGNTSGMLFTSTRNSKQLFMPFAGEFYNGSFINAGSSASVWSSQVYPSLVHNAYRLNCNSSGNAYINDGYRSCAFSVRGVFKTQE